MEKRVGEILAELQPDFDFTKDVHFVEMGYLDSFDIVTLVAEVEDEFSVIISALEIVPENFASVAAICSLISRSKKRGA